MLFRSPVQFSVALPLAAASDGLYVVDVILRGVKIRCLMYSVYGIPEYLEMRCEPRMYICSKEMLNKNGNKNKYEESEIVEDIFGGEGRRGEVFTY